MAKYNQKTIDKMDMATAEKALKEMETNLKKLEGKEDDISKRSRESIESTIKNLLNKIDELEVIDSISSDEDMDDEVEEKLPLSEMAPDIVEKIETINSFHYDEPVEVVVGADSKKSKGKKAKESKPVKVEETKAEKAEESKVEENKPETSELISELKEMATFTKEISKAIRICKGDRKEATGFIKTIIINLDKNIITQEMAEKIIGVLMSMTEFEDIGEFKADKDLSHEKYLKKLCKFVEKICICTIRKLFRIALISGVELTPVAVQVFLKVFAYSYLNNSGALDEIDDGEAEIIVESIFGELDFAKIKDQIFTKDFEEELKGNKPKVSDYGKDKSFPELVEDIGYAKAYSLRMDQALANF